MSPVVQVSLFTAGVIVWCEADTSWLYKHLNVLIRCTKFWHFGLALCQRSSFSRYTFLSDLTDLEVDFYSLHLYTL